MGRAGVQPWFKQFLQGFTGQSQSPRFSLGLGSVDTHDYMISKICLIDKQLNIETIASHPHQGNISMKSLPPSNPSWPCRGIPIFLTEFDPKQRLWILVRTGSYVYPKSLIFGKNKNNIKQNVY